MKSKVKRERLGDSVLPNIIRRVEKFMDDSPYQIDRNVAIELLLTTILDNIDEGKIKIWAKDSTK